MTTSSSKVFAKALMIALISLTGNACTTQATTPRDQPIQDNSSHQTSTASPLESDKPVQMPSSPQTIPFELKDNLVRIEVEVNGQKHSGVLDSGAGAILIDRAVSGKLGLQEGGSIGDAAGAGTEAKQLLPLTIANLVAGPLAFTDVPGYALDLGQLSSSAQFPVDVLLGAPAFKYGAVSVDYARRKVTFGPSGSPGKCAAPIPMEVLHDAPVVDIDVWPARDQPPVRLKVLVDLGTRHSALVLGGSFVRSEVGKALVQGGISKQIGHGVGGEVQGTVARVQEVRAGSTSFGELEVSLTSNTPAFEQGVIDGTLGVPLWSGGVISFDYPRGQICITRQ
ncbi:TPA: retropepsin-like aspartic protease [Pseudomonas aeruginosa]|uniref:retropepsin-like aspartic protease n=1 Tax=Pseudomonas aeruginosa TaxID=287 RepID=UPI0021E79E3E|nr:retropepsin-like aspartic protease [Pseudomonas aeruginosa]MCV3903005.1 retropepsin-like domain-containing protein [Pseudomonas aeruginosa]HBN9664626.1 retropepsin-like domain-containing protein [Pseudomonas aeruginosa]HCE6886246.1 retropepsin-like domain-containing protein [Pseudomonas aeruginosa]